MQLPPLALYVHLPWCERKCPYCDFNSHEARDIPEQDYLTALFTDLRADLHLVQGRAIDSLFIGGGTPSLFSAAGIDELLRGIAALLPLAPDMEATMEANPGSAEAGKFAGFRAAGINRLSLGIQSFQGEQLQALGRVHDAQQAHAAIDCARAAGFENFNLDLMHGLPGQTTESALQDLRAALEYQPTHLSWYQLTIEANTVFHKHPPLLPVEDTLEDIQLRGEHLLAQHGYRQYEVSAYSRANRSCRHNRNYWEFGDYLGIGAGAHGKITLSDGRIQRLAKTRQPGDYMGAHERGHIATRRWLGQDEIIGEFMLNNLRLNAGFSLSGFEERTGLDNALLTSRLDALCQRELLEHADGVIRATALGRRFLDTVIAEFF